MSEHACLCGFRLRVVRDYGLNKTQGVNDLHI